MGRRRITKPQTVSIKLSDAEFADMERLMAEAGYRNRSLFIRERVFAVKVGSRKERAGADAVPGGGAGSDSRLVWHVRKVGLNVNRACASVNAIVSRMGADNPKATRALEYWLKKISGYLYRIESLLRDPSGAPEVGPDSAEGNDQPR